MIVVFSRVVYYFTYNIQAKVYTRGAAVFKLECAQEEQQYSIWSVHKRSSSIQAGVCTRGAAVFQL
jgi:hypothetical protein